MATSHPEGLLFLIPTDQAPPALGVVARRQARGHCVALYIYAFAPEVASAQQMPELPSPAAAVYKGRFSDRCLRTGDWPLLGVHPDFKRDEWPFGEVLHREHLTGRCEIVRLDDRNPLKMVGFEPIDCDRGSSLPSDSIESPYIFVKETLPGLRGLPAR